MPLIANVKKKYIGVEEKTDSMSEWEKDWNQILDFFLKTLQKRRKTQKLIICSRFGYRSPPQTKNGETWTIEFSI